MREGASFGEEIKAAVDWKRFSIRERHQGTGVCFRLFPTGRSGTDVGAPVEAVVNLLSRVVYALAVLRSPISPRLVCLFAGACCLWF